MPPYFPAVFNKMPYAFRLSLPSAICRPCHSSDPTGTYATGKRCWASMNSCGRISSYFTFCIGSPFNHHRTAFPRINPKCPHSHPIAKGQQNAALVPIPILQAGKAIDYPFRVSQLVLKFLEKIMLKLDFIVRELKAASNQPMAACPAGA